MKRTILLLLLLAFLQKANAQLTLTNGQSATTLVNTILGSGVTVSNVTYTGAGTSKGQFTCSGACNLGVGSGVVLSSGVVGPPASPASVFHSDDMGNPGDATLDGILNNQTSYDASVLEFDFSVASDSVQFQYVFGSEEYNEWVSTSFNDVFGFFISGPGITGQKNIALIPNTTTPVSINNVNNGNSGTAASGPCQNCTYYDDNYGGTSVYLDGFTVVLTAKEAVQPCETYHIKLAIADVSDHIYNSDVFIAANSFSSLGQIQLYANGIAVSNNDTVYGCVGGNVTLALNPAQNWNWSTGATTQSITVPVNATPQVYSAYVFNPVNFCFAFTTQITVMEAPATATITPNGPTSLCPGGSVMLTANAGNTYVWSNGATSQSITVGTAGTYTVTVSNGPGCTAVSNPVTVTVGSANATISGPSALCNGAAANLSANLGQAYIWSTGATTQIITASMSGTYTVTVTQAGGCTATASTTLNVNANPVPVISGVNIICQGASTTFNAGVYAQYLWSTGATSSTINPAVAGIYSVTVTDANGCTGSATYSLTINPNPVPAISGINTVCQGFAASLDAGAGFANYQWSNGAVVQTINPTTSGTYTVTVSSAAGCTGTATQNVTVNPLPVPTITGITAVCQGAAANLDAGVGYVSYQWSTGANTQVINPTTTGNYTVTVTDANGCSGAAFVNVVVSANPTTTVTGVNSICQGASTTFDAGAGFATYQWSNGASTQTINPTTSGAYIVTVANAAGCTGTSQLTLTVNANPVPVVTGVNSICQGTATSFDAGAGYTSYQWTGGGNTQTINLNTSGIYTCTVTDGNGCTGSSSLQLTVNALPQPNITGVLTVCSGTAANLDAGNGYTTYQWSNGSNTQLINSIASGVFTVTVTDANGCTGSVSANVTVNSNPQPAVTGVNTICQGTPTTFDAGAGYTVYQWSNGGASQIINPTTSGTYIVTVTDVNGCTGTSSLTLTVNANPVPVVTGVNAICQGTSTTFDAGGGFTSYQWSNGGNGQTIYINSTGNYTCTVTDVNGCTGSAALQLTVNALPVPVISGQSSICDGNNSLIDAGNGYQSYQWNNGNNSQTQNISTAGNYVVTVTDFNGCTGSASFNLTVNPNPVPVITGPSSICDGQPATLDGGSGFVSYVWSNGSNSSAINPTLSNTFVVTVTDANGCTGSSAPFNFTVLYATATITPSGPTEFCRGGIVTLAANSGSTYQWSNGSSSQNITCSDNGTFTVVVVNSNGCTATSAPVTVTVHEYPVVKFNYDSTSLCKALRIAFSNLSIYDQGSAFHWDFGDGYTSNLKDPIHDYKQVGDYWVVLTITSPFGCSSVDSMKIHASFDPPAVPMFTMTPDLQNVFNSTIIFTDQSQNAYTWHWDFGDKTVSVLQNPTHQYDEAGTFTVTLTVTNKNNCEESYSREVTIAPFWIPNAFTPNDDGKNDVFFDGSYTLDVASFNMVIFNRWGQQIFETDSYKSPWRGLQPDGQPAPIGTYVYMIKVVTNSGKVHTFKGIFDLLR